MADDKIIIEFDGDIKALKAKLKSSQKEASKLAKIGKGIDKAITASAGAATVAIGGITAALAGAVSQAAKFETIATQFEVLTGSATEAKKVVEDLQQFSANTPFQFEGISTAAQQLLGFGFEVDEIIPKLQQIGDVASAIGRPIDEIGFLFGKVSAQSKLTGETLQQFQERAIPIGPAIAKVLKKPEEAIKDLVSRGEIDFKTFEKAFQSLSKEGGFAFGGMIKQSKTLGGLFSTVADNTSLLAADIGKELLPAAKNLATAFLNILKSARETDNFITTTVKFWGGIVADAFDQSSAASKKSFDQIKKDLDDTEAKISKLEKFIAERKTIPLYNSSLGRAEEDLQELSELYAQSTILKEQAAAKEKEIETKRAIEKQEAADKEKDEQRDREKKNLNEKIERMLEEDEILKQIQEELGEGKFLQEEARLKKIEDLTKSSLEKNYKARRDIEKADIKASIKENKLRLQQEKQFGEAIAGLKAFFRSKEYAAVSMSLDALTTLSNTGNKKLVAIAKAASLAKVILNTGVGITRAFADLPYPLAVPVAATIGITGAVQAAQMAGVKFADGGMFTGGVPGVDSIPAVLQQGEIVAPTRNFEEVIGSVRAKREAERLGGEGTGIGGAMEVIIGFTDNAFEIIEEKIIERRETGVGLI